MTTTHDDMHRDMGRMEGKQDAMGARLDRLEKIIEDGFDELRKDIQELKLREGERSALERAAVWLIGIVSALFAACTTAIVEHILR